MTIRSTSQAADQELRIALAVHAGYGSLETVLGHKGSFSHHQPYSVLSGGGENLQAKLGTVLETGQIYAWFFGHEHRLILYAPHSKWGVSARCVGHGGFPEFRARVAGCGGPDTKFVSLSKKPDVPASELIDGPNPFVNDSPSDPAKYNPHGYLTLQFAGPKIWETYFDPDGTPYREPAVLRGDKLF